MSVEDFERLREIQTLLYDEADCLDRADLDAWMALYTEDATYWMPASPDQPDPHDHVSHIYDDRVMMEIRRRNFVHPRAPSKDHAVRCSHLLGNMRLLQSDESAQRFTVRSNFHVVMLYREEKRVYAGTCTHELVRVEGALRIRHKRVDLIDCDEAHRSIIIYL